MPGAGLCDLMEFDADHLRLLPAGRTAGCEYRTNAGAFPFSIKAGGFFSWAGYLHVER